MWISCSSAYAVHMDYRTAVEEDLDLLAEWNYQLIRDEGHRNQMDQPQLKERMRGYISGNYTAIIFTKAAECVYALYQETSEEIYLRQFFVARDLRRQGLGKQAMGLLFNEIWPKNKRRTVAVLTANAAALEFWKSLGYRDYCLKLELPTPWE